MNQSLVLSVAGLSGANGSKTLIRRVNEYDSSLGEQRDYRIAREAAGGAEGEERDGGAVAAHPREGASVGRALRDQAADEVGGHAASGIGDGGDREREGRVSGPQVQVGEQRGFRRETGAGSRRERRSRRGRGVPPC
jgi:hypothetical protein